MMEYFSADRLMALGEAIYQWVLAHVLVASNAIQLAVVGVALAIALWVSRQIVPWLQGVIERRAWPPRVGALLSLTTPLVWLGMQWLSRVAANALQWPSQLLGIIVSLLTAWVVIRLVSQFARDPVWSTLIAWTAWTIAALDILNLLDPMIMILDSAALTVGQFRISVYMVMKTALELGILLWLALYVSGLLESRLRASRNLSASVQVLFAKAVKMGFVGLALLIGVRSVGIDLTAFAVIGGAIGLGAGFGFQRIVSNLIGGLMLLLDKSIKPGDVITVAGTYGWVTALGGRYVSVVTRDGIEHLIPNEILISQPVENWTHSNNQTRLKVPVRVHFKSDLRLAIGLCEEAARETPRVLEQPEPRCLMLEFGEHGIQLELRIWIADAYNGVQNIKSEVLLKIWDKFQAHGIEVPYPQRDLHMRDASPPAMVPAAAL